MGKNGTGEMAMTPAKRAMVDRVLAACEKQDGAVAGVARELTREIEWSQLTAAEQLAQFDKRGDLRRAVGLTTLDARALARAIERPDAALSKGVLLRAVRNVKNAAAQVEAALLDEQLLINS